MNQYLNGVVTSFNEVTRTGYLYHPDIHHPVRFHWKPRPNQVDTLAVNDVVNFWANDFKANRVIAKSNPRKTQDKDAYICHTPPKSVKLGLGFMRMDLIDDHIDRIWAECPEVRFDGKPCRFWRTLTQYINASINTKIHAVLCFGIDIAGKVLGIRKPCTKREVDAFNDILNRALTHQNAVFEMKLSVECKWIPIVDESGKEHKHYSVLEVSIKILSEQSENHTWVECSCFDEENNFVENQYESYEFRDYRLRPTKNLLLDL